MTAAKKFHLGDLLSITTHALVSPRHMAGVYDICDFVTGEAHMTHQLIRAAGVVGPWLIEQHPWLKDIEAPAFGIPAGASSEEAGAVVAEWVAAVAAEHGEWHDVAPMPFGMYVGQEPIAELQEMAPHAQIIAVEVDPDGGAS